MVMMIQVTSNPVDHIFFQIPPGLTICVSHASLFLEQRCTVQCNVQCDKLNGNPSVLCGILLVVSVQVQLSISSSSYVHAQ